MTTRPLAALALVVALAGCLSGGWAGANAVDGTPEPTVAATPTPTPTPSATPTPTATATTAPEPTETRSVPVQPYSTREALVEAAPFAVPDPDVPAAFEFDSGIVGEFRNASRVSIAYHYRVGGNTSDAQEGELRNVLSVGKFTGSPLNLSQGEAVTVDGRQMRYVEDGDRQALLWRCGGFTYRVSVQQFGDEFGKADLHAVAGSVECPETTAEGA